MQVRVLKTLDISIPTQRLIQYRCHQSVSHHAAEGLIRTQLGRIRPLIRDFGNDSIDSRNRRSRL